MLKNMPNLSFRSGLSKRFLDRVFLLIFIFTFADFISFFCWFENSNVYKIFYIYWTNREKREKKGLKSGHFFLDIIYAVDLPFFFFSLRILKCTEILFKMLILNNYIWRREIYNSIYIYIVLLTPQIMFKQERKIMWTA